MKTETIHHSIKAAKFGWVSDYAMQFPYEASREGDTEVFHFAREITSQEAIIEMQKEGYEPANSSELLEYAQDGWNGEDWVVELGTVWQDPNGFRRVLVLDFSDRERRLRSSWFDDGWGRDCRFVARRPRTGSLDTQPSALGSLDLELAKMNDPIKKRIKELVPDAGEDFGLAVVLRAIEGTERADDFGEIEYTTFSSLFHIGKYEKHGRNGYYSKCFWNLEKNYDDQSQETKDFIGKLLE